MQRREFIHRVSLVCATPLLAMAGNTNANYLALSSAMSEVVSQLPAATEIGEKVLSQLTLREIFHASQTLPHLSALQLRQLIHEELVNGTDVKVGGWIISRTESIICALNLYLNPGSETTDLSGKRL